MPYPEHKGKEMTPEGVRTPPKIRVLDNTVGARINT